MDSLTVTFKKMANKVSEEALAFAYNDGVIDDAEFAILYEENLSREMFP